METLNKITIWIENVRFWIKDQFLLNHEKSFDLNSIFKGIQNMKNELCTAFLTMR